MYLMYVDESGDPGLTGSPGRYFALSGLVVHESRWRDLGNRLVTFRKTIKMAHGLPLRTEIHAAHYVRKPPIGSMPKYVRLSILRNLLDEIAKIDYVSITNVVVDKSTKPAGYDVFDSAWKALFQRFENTMQYGNFPGGHRDDKGIVFVDNTNGEKLRALMRRMAVYNPIPNSHGGGYRQLPVVRVIEDPHGKDSADSYFIQAVDVTAYFLYQKFSPNSFIKKAGAGNYFGRLGPCLNRRASYSDPHGIVLL